MALLLASTSPLSTWRVMACAQDPYFNYRSTKYLMEEGFYSFLNWQVSARALELRVSHANHLYSPPIRPCRTTARGTPLDVLSVAPCTQVRGRLTSCGATRSEPTPPPLPSPAPRQG